MNKPSERPKLLNTQWPRYLPLALALLVFVSFASIWVIGSIGPNQDYRNRAFQVLQREMDALPPPPGSVAYQPVKYDEPFRTPTLENDYQYSVSCAEVQAHYAAVTELQGWTVQQPLRALPNNHTDPKHTTLDARYWKQADGFALLLTVECYVQKTYPTDWFTLSMDAN